MSFNSTSSVALFLQHALGVPPTKVAIGPTAFAAYVLPPVVCYLAAAMLAVTAQTRTLQVAMCPLIALLALRAALSVDMALDKPERKFLSIDLVLSMLTCTLRSLEWALAKEPLVRHDRPGNRSKSVLFDALDLASSLRGHGWEWSRGMYFPRERRPTNRIAFVFCTFLSAVVHILLCGAFHRAVLTFAPVGSGSTPQGSSIFDDNLPFSLRYLRSSIIATLTAFAVYTVLQMGYDLCTLTAVLFLGQDPAQWPPAFEAPWLATSLADFWGRRWHQWFRHTFLFVGGRPLSLVLGRTGIVLGAFLSSAVFHHVAMMTLDARAEVGWMLVGFGIMGPGILAERAFRECTGKRVCGIAGWIWTMSWLLVWGKVLVEGFARAGMFGCSSFIDSALPVRIRVEHWVAGFDAWLHTI